MMERSPRIKLFPQTTLGELDGGNYRSAIASVGYEHRARQIPEALGITGLAVPFDDHIELDYEENLEYFRGANWKLPEIEEKQFAATVRSWLAQNCPVGSDQPLRLAADVSSMSRRRIADLVEAVLALPENVSADIDFLYTPAEFAAPEPDREPSAINVAPVSDAFAGWWNDLDKPLHAIVGLGYELERAASAIDVLEPDTTQIYVPAGKDPRYLEAVTEANKGLEEMPGVLDGQVSYPVDNPFACFQTLEATISRIAPTDRIALIPLGPKIFALVVTLAAAIHPTSVQVIRVSAGKREAAHQRHSDGSVCGLTISLRPPPDPHSADSE